MADTNNKNPDKKQPGEKPEGTYHFNPGNQSGKGPDSKDGAEQQNGTDTADRKKP